MAHHGPQQSADEGPAGATAGPVLARFARPTTATRTTLAVLSDVHLSTDATGTWKLFHRTEARLRTAVADVNDRDVDGVVVAGDLSRDGGAADLDRAATVLADLDAPLVAVPGNHDVPKDFDEHETPPRAAFVERFTPGELPFHARLGGVDVLGLDSATHPDGSLSDTHDGAVSADQRDWLAATLPGTDAPLVVSHHNLPGLRSTVGTDWRGSFPMGAADALVDVLATHDAPLHLSGHLHVPAVADSGGVAELLAPSLCSFPQGYLLLTVGPAGTTVRYAPVADAAGAEEAFMAARAESERARAVAELAQSNLDAAPLVDELADALPVAASAEAD